MKSVLFLVQSICISIVLQRQPLLDQKKYVATIGWICEEVEGEGFCIGEEIQLVLEFHKETVAVSTQEVDSCQKIVQTKPIGVLKFNWAKNKYWFLQLDTSLIQNADLETISIYYKEDTLFGRKNTNEKLEEYRFRESKKT